MVQGVGGSALRQPPKPLRAADKISMDFVQEAKRKEETERLQSLTSSSLSTSNILGLDRPKEENTIPKELTATFDYIVGQVSAVRC